ncbi:MAG: EAL domain-containing protein [Desulfotalea sp.]
MTLYKQLVVFTLTLFILLFAGLWFEKLQSTRLFLVSQMESHAQDTATSLGLSLSPIMAENDIAAAETMMNAVFDRGYYRVISLKDIEGEIIYDRSQQVTLEGVPPWFVEFVIIQAPKAESLVMSGWSQAGTLYVESHPGYAYRTMWEDAIKMALFFVVAGSVVLALGGLGLRIILKPLKRVEQQAEAICKKEYRIQEKLPKTKELRQVVESMNKMTAQVRDMFSRQAKVAEKLRLNAYSDQLTGLGNRRYITGQVEARLEAEKGVMQGAFLMLQLDDLQKINDNEGYEAADNVLKKIADIIKEETQMLKDVALARLTGGDFAIFISEISSAAVYEIAEKLSKRISLLASESSAIATNLANIGGVAYDSTPTLSILLAEADSALQAARQKGGNKWLINLLSENDGNAVKGKKWWKETLEKVLAKGEIILFNQPIVSCVDHGEVLHRELLSRIKIDSGEVVSAGMFIPLAEQLQLISKLDMVVLKQVFAEIQTKHILKSIAVNLSPSSINDEEFVEWLLKELTKIPHGTAHIIFEFPEFGAVQFLDTIKDFARKIQELGHGIALDHFGQSFSNFGYLKSLRPEYVKIDRAFTNELDNEQGDSEFFIGALCGVAHSLDIQVIAEGVEEAGQVEKLLDLDVDALQGYHFGKPEQI